MLLNALEQVGNVSFPSLHYSNTSEKFIILMDEQTKAGGDGVQVCVCLEGVKCCPPGPNMKNTKE